MGKADKPKADKPRIRKWRGLLAGAPRRVRLGAFALLAITVAALVFTQLGLVGLGPQGQYAAYGNVLLTVVALGGLLFGMPLGTLLGLIAGVMMFVHAQVQPLDYYEIMYVTPVTSIMLFTFIGLFASFMFALALRRNPSLARRIIYIIIISVILSLVYTLFFVLNIFMVTVIQLALIYSNGTLDVGSVEVQNIVVSTVGQLGDVRIQFAFDASLMIALCIVADILTRKARENEGNHSLLTIVRGWLVGIVVAVFAITSGVSFVLITEQAKDDADQQMQSELEYLTKQLKVYDDRWDLIRGFFASGNLSQDAMTEEDWQKASEAFSSDNLLSGYNVRADGTVVVFSDGKVLLTDDANYPVGESCEDIFGSNAKAYLDSIVASDKMQQVEHRRSLGSDQEFDTIDDYVAAASTTEMAFMRVAHVDDYYVMITYPASKVFESRVAVMASTTLSVIAMLVVIFVFFSFMLHRIVLRRIDETNGVLAQITDGDLAAKVNIRDSREFKSLSTGINTTVDALRGWIAEAETRMESELATAKAIQESALPRIFPPYPDIRRFDIYASMNPAREVGGDFYDFFLIGDDSNSDEGKLGFVLADVSGKGVPAALFMMTAKTLLRDYMRSGIALGEAVENANRQLCDGNDAGMFVTAFVGVLEYPSGHVTFVNAGHNPPLLWQQGSWRWITERSGLPLGLFDGFPYESFEVDCGIGDQFFVYTDGVTEAMNVDGELYGEERLEALMNEHFDEHPRELIHTVREDVATHASGADQSDDITMLALEVGVPPEITATLVVPAVLSELPHVIDFIHTELDRRLCPVKTQKQLDVAVEEMFVNVANYAYPDATPENPGAARIGYTYSAEPPSVTVEIADDGIPYNPLAKPDAVTPDDIMDVPIGGLGILMAKKSVDEMTYERIDGSNVVTLKKKW